MNTNTKPANYNSFPENRRFLRENDFTSGLMSGVVGYKSNIFPYNSWLNDFIETNRRLSDYYLSHLPDICDFKSFGQIDYFDLNCTHTNVSESTSKTLANTSEDAFALFNGLYSAKFQKDLASVGIDDESIDFLYAKVSELMVINRVATLSLIQDIYLKNQESENLNLELTLKILRVIHRFEYQDMRPFSQLIVSSAIHANNPRIQLDALKVVDRWGNKEALNILDKMECPSHPWARLKFNSLLNTLRHDLS